MTKPRYYLGDDVLYRRLDGGPLPPDQVLWSTGWKTFGAGSVSTEEGPGLPANRTGDTDPAILNQIARLPSAAEARREAKALGLPTKGWTWPH